MQKLETEVSGESATPMPPTCTFALLLSSDDIFRESINCRKLSLGTRLPRQAGEEQLSTHNTRILVSHPLGPTVGG